jgi:hypothetical protein
MCIPVRHARPGEPDRRASGTAGRAGAGRRSPPTAQARSRFSRETAVAADTQLREFWLARTQIPSDQLACRSAGRRTLSASSSIARRVSSAGGRPPSDAPGPALKMSYAALVVNRHLRTAQASWHHDPDRRAGGASAQPGCARGDGPPGMGGRERRYRHRARDRRDHVLGHRPRSRRAGSGCHCHGRRHRGAHGVVSGPVAEPVISGRVPAWPQEITGHTGSA